MGPHVRRWLPWALGMALGASLVVAIPLIRGLIRRHFGEGLAPLPQPESRVAGESDAGVSLPVGGKVRTVIDDFSMDDPEGHRVVHIEHLEASVNADAMRMARLHMPTGEARGVRLLLRRGPSGHVSLTESLKTPSEGNATDAPEADDSHGMHLDIGPLKARDILLTIAMSDNPVVVHLDRADLRVQRTHDHPETRVFLSNIQGRLVKPDPLPNPIEIHDGQGVVDLGEGPLVDMRVRICLARGELRMGIRVPARKSITHLFVDGDRFMGHTAMAALGLVGRFKDNLEVERAPVEVRGGRQCEGRTGD